MRCSNCSQENAATSKFCISCGKPLQSAVGAVSRIEFEQLKSQIRALRDEIEKIRESVPTGGVVGLEAEATKVDVVEPVEFSEDAGASHEEYEPEAVGGVEPLVDLEPLPESEPQTEPEPGFTPKPVLLSPIATHTVAGTDPQLPSPSTAQAKTTPVITQAEAVKEPERWETISPNEAIQVPSWSFSDLNWEPIIGGNWLARVGALAIIIGIGFFLNLAFENNWIGETGRVILGIVSGLAFLAAGEYWRTKYPVYSQALTGTGIAILYIAIFAAFAIYSLIDIYTGISMLLLVSVTSAVLAIRQNSVSLAVLGIIGAFLGPFILGASSQRETDSFNGSTGDAFGLLAYIFVVDIGVIVLSTFKSWRWFTALAYAGSLITFGLWFTEYGMGSSALVAEFGRPETQLIAEAGLTSIFLSFVAATTLFHLVWKRNPESRDLTLMLVNASVYMGISYGLLWNDFRAWMGGFTILVSMLYTGVGYIALKRVGLVSIDLKNPARDMLLTSISFGIALILITAAIPIQIGGPWVPVVWATESVLLIWLSFKQRMPDLRVGALVVLGLAAAWLGIVETPDALRDSVTPFWNEYLPAYIAVIAAFWAGAMLVKQNSDQLNEIEKHLFRVLAVFGIFFLALGTPVQVPETWLPVAWTLEGVAIFWASFNQREAAVRYGALTVLGIGALWLVSSVTPDALRDLPTPFWNEFLPIYLMVIAGFWVSGFIATQNDDQLPPDEKMLVPVLVLTGIFLLSLGTTIQVSHTWLPVAWVVESVVLVWIAFERKALSLRYGALALLTAGGVWLGLVETPHAIESSPMPFWNVQLPIYLIFIAGTWTIAFLVKQNKDQLRREEKSLFSVVVLVGFFFMALGASVQLGQSWLPLAWTVEALVLLWFAFNQNDRIIRYGALTVLAFGAFWLGVVETPAAIRDSHPLFLNTLFPVYTVVIAGIWIAAYLARRNDDQLKAEESKLYELLSVIGIFFLALGTPVQVDGSWMAFAWAIEGLAVIWVAMRLGIFEAQISGLILFALAAIRAIGYDSVVDGTGYTVLWNTRLIAFGPLIAGMATAAYLWSRSVSPHKDIEPTKIAASMAVAANAFALWFLSAEVIGAVQADALFSVSDSNERDVVSLGLTVLWGAYGGLVLTAGFIGDWRLVRSAGLILLAIPVFKLFLIDSFQLDQGLRVAAFLILGAILLAGGYLYQRNSELIKELFIRPTTPGRTDQAHRT